MPLTCSPTYQYDPSSGAIVYGETDADAFIYDRTNRTYYLSACGCPAATGCRCRQVVLPVETPRRTPLAEVRAGVERVRREMAAERAEREAERSRRRVRNEMARAYRAVSSRPVPEPYTEALAKLGAHKSVSVVYDSAGVPLPYDTALQRR